MRKLFFFLLFITLQTAYTQEVPTQALPGCPLFSFCNAKAGQTKQSWDNEIQMIDQLKLKDSKRLSRVASKVSKWGLPFKAWSKKVVPDHISWTSQCVIHKKKKAFTTMAFLKDLKSLPENLLLDRMFIQKGKKISTSYRPRDEFPVFVDNKGHYFIMEYDGIYFYYLLTKNNQIEIVSPPYKERIKPQKVICPKNLIIKAKEDPFITYFYRYTTCRKVWNYSENKFHTYLLGQRCYK